MTHQSLFQILFSLFFVTRGSHTKTFEGLSRHEADGLEHLLEDYVKLDIQWLRLFCCADIDLVRCPAEEDEEFDQAHPQESCSVGKRVNSRHQRLNVAGGKVQF